jgi:hypothetical protein
MHLCDPSSFQSGPTTSSLIHLKPDALETQTRAQTWLRIMVAVMIATLFS